MNYKMIRYMWGLMLLVEAAMLLIPAIVAICYGESVLPFVFTILIILVFAVPFVIFKPNNTRIYAREGFVCVGAMWVFMSALGALPFVFSGAIPNFIDAFFETASGFSTTGASILREIESLPKGILFWRSLTHWIGGMGVLVFMLAILPKTDGNVIHLMRAEVPGPTKGKIVPKMRHTAMILYGIYIGLTVLMAICLLCTGMPFYDSLVNAIATAGTGGFSVKNASIASYANPAAEWVITVFMFVFGINFSLYFFVLTGKIREMFKNEELKVYIGLTLSATAIIAASTWGMFDKAGDCIRTAAFQVATVMSTTGYSTADFNLWPEIAKAVLVMLMFTGACAGSTAGGLKISRVIIIFKNMAKEVKHMINPYSVSVVKLDKEPVAETTVRSAVNYLGFYLAMIIFSVVAISIDGFDFTTNTTAVISCVNNIGPGLAKVGPMGNFADYSAFSKVILSFDMLFGRLEIIPMLILFLPSTWKKR